MQLNESFVIGALSGGAAVAALWVFSVWLTPQRRATFCGILQTIGTFVALPFIMIATMVALIVFGLLQPFREAAEAFRDRQYGYMTFTLFLCAGAIGTVVLIISHLPLFR